MRLHKRKSLNRHRHAAARTYGWATFLSWFTSPDRQTPPVAAGSGPLLPLPHGAMPQRTVKLPQMPARTAYPAETLASARRVTGTATAGPAYRIDPNAPLFRDEQAVGGYEERREARIREIQRFVGKPWPDGQGVSLGSDQSPKTITWSTTDYREFAGSHPKASA